MEFEKSVFINCPFDHKYYDLLKPLLFTIIYLGFIPRISLESLNSGKPRIAKILKLIEESKFAIHDLSRMKAEKQNEYYRLNMAFELGLDIGCQLFKKGKWSQKQCLILEAEQYRYQAALSDLSNSDIAVHQNHPKQIIVEVRNWLNTSASLHADGLSKIWTHYNNFMATIYDTLKMRGFSEVDVRNLPISELMIEMKT